MNGLSNYSPQSQFLGESDFPSFGLGFYKDERIRLVQHFFEKYSALSLTYATDRPKAIAGLQSRIAAAFNSDATHGVVWRWPERMLLWCAAQPGALTRIEYANEATAPPSWSWMAYDGRITFLKVPFKDVVWTHNVDQPEDLATGGHRLLVKASILRIDVDELRKRAVIDVQDIELSQAHVFEVSDRSIENLQRSIEGGNSEDKEGEIETIPRREMSAPPDWRGVLLGQRSTHEVEDGTELYVLLIRPVQAPSARLGLYERIGVAKLAEKHVDDVTVSVLLI